jgi:hypothetical protein
MSTPKTTETPPAPAPELANVKVRTLSPRVAIGNAICSGEVPFGLTQTQAEALVAAGLVEIIGIF